jgi:hypothetical protein
MCVQSAQRLNELLRRAHEKRAHLGHTLRQRDGPPCDSELVEPLRLTRDHGDVGWRKNLRRGDGLRAAEPSGDGVGGRLPLARIEHRAAPLLLSP